MISLKDELTYVHQQLKDAVSKNEQLQTSKDNYIKKLEEQLREKQKEISKLSEEVKSYDPKKIKDSVLRDATDHYESKIREIETEAAETKEKYVKVRHENALLRCDLTNCKSEFSHMIERLKVEHLSEVQRLQNEREAMKMEESPDSNTVIELKAARHDILELNAKIKGLLAECEELRAKNEELTLGLNSTNRIHLKQSADNLSNIRALESEKQKVLTWNESLEKEVANLQEKKRILNIELQDSRREILVLTSKLEESEHKCHVVMTDLQIKNEQLKNEYMSEREMLSDEITKIKSELRDKITELNNVHQALMSKEHELQQNSAIAQQQLWKQSNEFQEEIGKNEKKFQDFKNQKDQYISQLKYEILTLKQNLDSCLESKLELEKELQSTKEKLEEVLRNKSAHSDKMSFKEKLEYEQQIQILKDEINHLKSSSNIYFEEKDRFSEMLLRRRTELAHEDDREVLELKLSWEQQKHQFHQRIQDLESQLKDVKNNSVSEKEKLEHRIEQYSRQVNKLKDKLGLLKSKKDELENLTETLEKNVPLEIHMQVKNKLSELYRRLEEYRLIVAAEPHFPACSKSSTGLSDKLLTDVKNLQLKLPVSEDLSQEYETFKYAKEKQTDKSKKTSNYKRRPLKARNRDIPSKTKSPNITSSSDLEYENL